METITYNLQDENNNSTDFYRNLSRFTDWILFKKEYNASWRIHRYIDYMDLHHIEKIRTYSEYYLEYLTMGILLNQHAGKALNSSRIIRSAVKKLFILRKKYQSLKPTIDHLRGYLLTFFLAKKEKNNSIQNIKEFRIFIDWLYASAEYKEEAKRFENWATFFESLDPLQFQSYINITRELASLFEQDALQYLGTYTKNVEYFRQNKLMKHKYKENYLFCGKAEVEYHLNMFGAEILNRALRENFDKTTKKILLLPTCMCKPNDGLCKSVRIDNKVFCTSCSATCPVNIIKKRCLEKGVGTNLILHSSSFSKYLREWKGSKETGLIGVGCVLNLLTGGYELIKLDIPSQCIFLDYCGCKKHWHKEGIATNINLECIDKTLENMHLNIRSNNLSML